MIYIYFILLTSFMGHVMPYCFGSNPPFVSDPFDTTKVTTGPWSVIRRTVPYTSTSRCETRTFSGNPLSQLASAYIDDSQTGVQTVTSTFFETRGTGDGYYTEDTDIDYRFIEAFEIIEVMTQLDPVNDYAVAKDCGDSTIEEYSLDPSDLVDIDHTNCNVGGGQLKKFNITNLMSKFGKSGARNGFGFFNWGGRNNRRRF